MVNSPSLRLCFSWGLVPYMGGPGWLVIAGHLVTANLMLQYRRNRQWGHHCPWSQSPPGCPHVPRANQQQVLPFMTFSGLQCPSIWVIQRSLGKSWQGLLHDTNPNNAQERKSIEITSTNCNLHLIPLNMGPIYCLLNSKNLLGKFTCITFCICKTSGAIGSDLDEPLALTEKSTQQPTSCSFARHFVGKKAIFFCSFVHHDTHQPTN